ncbi:DUF2931 family protein [Flavobacterium sp. 270]|nr:DUF2931 family protein [Flavobacterium sp. 270]
MVVLLIIVLGCKKQEKDMFVKIEKFEWSSAVSADECYPMRVINGSFILSDSTSVWIPSREILRGTWGFSNSSYVVGEDNKKVPESMEITWFSYTENKFYTGDFELPQKKIYEIFKKDYGTSFYPDGEEYKKAYNTLEVGIAPLGMITVWMGGSAGYKEIGTYQAHETFDEDWNDFSKNLDRKSVMKSYYNDFLPFVQKEIDDNKISNTYFKNLLKRYHYTIGTNNPDFKIYDFDIPFLNGEVIDKSNAGLEFLTDIVYGKGIPKTMAIFIKDRFNRKLEVRIWVDLLDGKTVDENDHLKDPMEERVFNNQLMNRFESFFEKNKNVELYIKFDKEIKKSNINKPVYCGKVCLKSPTNELKIPNSKVEVYDAQ